MDGSDQPLETAPIVADQLAIIGSTDAVREPGGVEDQPRFGVVRPDDGIGGRRVAETTSGLSWYDLYHR